ncbi:flagellar export chaperone FliS [Oscillibacter ruminantium]|jgi:flagellar protein FliS|uniref:flagellar export chaperone FliS n=1 Tax=Oscillibacter ruminantium TaxID=1263547 RepID=UPI0002F6F409|nr:flagellar export chaperone FliS [Oscillibacter ruminantium]MDN0033638.1 flagellar export chaperone FliS [Oscillibacter valericigenes]MEA5041882.1 flagellar export chaperone FliS [Oscillibacter ruminantium]
MEAQGYQQYKQQSVNTMTQGELLVVLYDELVKRAARADIALDRKDYPLFEASVDRCLDILHYLDDTLDRQYPVSAELHRLYDFFCYDFNRIKAGRNQEELSKLRPMVTELRDSFRTAEKNTSAR